MPDFIITTPKSQIANVAAEAEDAKTWGEDAYYFRRFAVGHAPKARMGDRVFYVENGFIRGFAVVDTVEIRTGNVQCFTTETIYAPGVYVWMRADSWKWIFPIPMKGFQGFRYADETFRGDELVMLGDSLFEVLGGWLDPAPPVAGCQSK